MAEAIAAISLVQTIIGLTDFGRKVVKRLNEFKNNVQDLPEAFQHIGNQLPILMRITNSLEERAKNGDFAPDAQRDLEQVIIALKKELLDLDALLAKILPSARASTWEKGVKAVKSIKAQKSVDTYSTVIQTYVQTLSNFQVADHANQMRIIIDFVKQLKFTESDSPRESSHVTPPRKPVWMLEFDGDEDFVGREETMAEVSSKFEANASRVAVVGVGGVGKTRIAIEHCQNQRQQQPNLDIFWIHGTSRAKFEAAYRKLARLMKMPGLEDKDLDLLQHVKDHLSETTERPWLMVLDNADDYHLWLRPGGASDKSKKPLIDYLPRSTGAAHGRILITTRDGQLGPKLTEGKSEPVQVNKLGAKDAASLLRAKLLEGKALCDEDADELTDALGHLPLTITQAAAYLNEIGISAAEYLTDFRQGLADIPELLANSIDDPNRDRDTSNSVFQTWRLSFEQISKQSPRAADILSLMAMLDRQGISQDLLRKDGESTLQFRAAISKLKAFSFITEEKKASKYSMHRLVQLSTQQWLEHLSSVPHYQGLAITAVSGSTPRVMSFDIWPVFVELRPHINTVLEYEVSHSELFAHRAVILHGIGHYSMEQGEEEVAQNLFNEAHAIRHKHLGPEHEDTLTTLSVLGVSLNKQGKWFDARPLQRDVLDRCHSALGGSHRLTLKSMSRLAATHNRGGENLGCLDIQLEVLKQMESELGPEDLDTLTEMSNLMYTLNKLQRWDEANRIGNRALELRTKILGSEHPDTVTIMAGLSITYNKQRRWDEAVEMEERVLRLREDALGPDHPKTLQAMENLSRNYGYQNRNSEAEQLLRHVVDVRLRTKGPDDSLTLRARSALNRYERQNDSHLDVPFAQSGWSQRGSPRGRPTPHRGGRAGNRGYHSRQGSRGGSPGASPQARSGSTNEQQQRQQSWADRSPPPPYTPRDLSGSWRRQS